MKTSLALLALSVAPFTLVLTGCLEETACPPGEAPVRVAVSSYSDRWVCAPRAVYPEARRPETTNETTPSPATPTTPSAPAAPPDDTGDTPTTAAPVTDPSGCGVVTVKGDVMRVIEKGEAAPVFAQGGSAPANGHYELVQASFFRREAGPLGVGRLVGAIDVQGTSIAIGAQNISEKNIEPNESMTFLYGENGLTKVCETRHGNVASFVFPIPTGSTGAARIYFEPKTSTLRLVVARPEGETELVFAR